MALATCPLPPESRRLVGDLECERETYQPGGSGLGFNKDADQSFPDASQRAGKRRARALTD